MEKVWELHESYINKIFRYIKQSINFFLNELRQEGSTFWLTYLMTIVYTATTTERLLEFAIFTAGGRCYVVKKKQTLTLGRLS